MKRRILFFVVAMLFIATVDILADVDIIANAGLDSYPTTLILDGDVIRGNTTYGGKGAGSSFKLPVGGGDLTVIHLFGSEGDGRNPLAGLKEGHDRKFYGVLARGPDPKVPQCAIFEMTPAGTPRIVYQFLGGNDGGQIAGDITLGDDIYGVAYSGGLYQKGLVFKLTLGGNRTVLHDFEGGTDGYQPDSPPLLASNGDLIGSVGYGGLNNGGLIYRIRDGNFSVPYAFPPFSYPGKVMESSDGNFYVGITNGGHNGAIVRMTQGGNVSTVKAFTDGSYPYYELVESDGLIFGVANNDPGGGVGNASVFWFNKAGEFWTTEPFHGNPSGALLPTSNALYGVMQSGEVFKIPRVKAKPVNIATRSVVGTGDNVMIGGFILNDGTLPGRVLIRAIGPSMGSSGVTGCLPDSILELHDATGALIASNDNWRSNQEAEIMATHLAPSNDLESAILANLPPGSYTAIVSGSGGGTGVALVEVYELDN